jgi:hypothetical protein
MDGPSAGVLRDAMGVAPVSDERTRRAAQAAPFICAQDGRAKGAGVGTVETAPSLHICDTETAVVVMVPAARQRVAVEGRNEVFLVLWVDHEHQAAELVPLINGDRLETVPFSSIRPWHGAAAGPGSGDGSQL